MENLSLTDYQAQAKETAIYGGSVAGVMATGDFVTTSAWMRLAYCAGKLNGEAGELGEEVFKMMRDDLCQLYRERRVRIVKELGDVLWYAAQIATELEVDLGAVAQANLEKLAGRKDRDTLHGSGEDR